jgi:hypothetical protein
MTVYTQPGQPESVVSHLPWYDNWIALSPSMWSPVETAVSPSKHQRASGSSSARD